MCNHIRRLKIQVTAFCDDLFQLLVHVLRKTFLHHFVIKHIFAKNGSSIYIFAHSFLLFLF